MIKNDKILATNAETATNLAVEAMLDEVVTWPKPGLVDPISNAGHTDMNVYTFINSSVTMMPYFKACWNLGNQFQESDLTELFRQLRPIESQQKRLCLQLPMALIHIKESSLS